MGEPISDEELIEARKYADEIGPGKRYPSAFYIRALIARLDAAEARALAAEAALRNIAQYHPEWKGQKVNNIPDWRKMVDWAFYALAQPPKTEGSGD